MMTYEIKHKSKMDCRIAYLVDSKPRSKKSLYIMLIVFGIIAIQIGIDLRIIVFGGIIISMIKIKARPRKTIFEIELNRVTNLISVKTPTRYAANIAAYPLSSFKGFGLYKLPNSTKMKGRSTAELFFIFDDTIDGEFLTSENSLLSDASQVTGENGHVFWHVPIQKRHHPTTLWKARKIIGTVDNWLALPSHDQRSKAPKQKTEIIRDFRELE